MSSSSTGIGSPTSKASRRKGNGDCGFTDAVSQPPDRSSPDFRRWSRNLSSRRHKELHRLNEIEKRRQLLELRRQNDLFDQMSVTVARQPVVVVEVDHRAGGLISDDFVVLSSKQPETRDKDKGLPAAHDSESSQQTDAVNPNDPTAGSNPKLDNGSTSAEATPLPRPHLDSATPTRSSRQLYMSGTREPEDDESVGSFSDDREEEPDETGDEEGACRLPSSVGIVENPTLLSDAVGKQVASDYDSTCRGPKQQSSKPTSAGDNTLISGSLAKLVCMPVPQNKRFLCWIVREKVSKLSKARPYFYPTYYLYIQSIVDIHNKAGGDDLARNKASLVGEPQQVVEEAEKSELISEDPLDSSRVQLPATSSADNSISESSSISADMLFMEALGKGTGSRSRPTRANSYSDTGVYTDQADTLIMNSHPADRQQTDIKQPDVVECFFDELTNPYSGANEILLAARRRKKTKTYLIGLNECGYARKNCICKLKSNVLGTNFSASLCSYDAKPDEQYSIASIGYETNVLGFRGPRKMRVFLPKESCNQRTKELPDLFKKKPLDVIHLKNMTPSWNIESQSYVLNFNGRVTQASVKNFQLIECDKELSGNNRASSTAGSSRSDSFSINNNSNNPSFDQGTSTTVLDSHNNSIVMQFGRISNHEFTCDITHPMSILQGFAIALSSLDSKLACE